MSDSNRVGIYAFKESAFGADPNPAPKLQEIPYTSESLGQDTTSTRSQTIRDDRQTSGIIRTDVSAGGDINFELNYGCIDLFLPALLQAADWESAVSIEGVSATFDAPDQNGQQVVSGTGVGAGLTNHKWVKITGATDAANNGFFKLAAVDANEITIVNANGVKNEVSASITVVQGSYIENGTTLSTFGIEKVFRDLSNEFEYNRGMGVNSGNFQLDTQQIVNGTLSFIGKSSESRTLTIGDGSPTSAPTGEIFNSIDNIYAINEAGVDLGMTSFGFTINNNLRARPQLGVLGAISLGSGTFEATGTLQKYFESKAMVDKYLQWETSSLSTILRDADGAAYVFEFPAIKYTQGRRVAGGLNQDVIADMTWEAFRSPVEGITCRVTRWPAPTS